MNNLLAATAISVLIATPAMAQTTTVQKTDDLFYSHRGEWRASKLIGTKVTNTAGETVGDINDLMINKDRNVTAAVMGVGGFLGVGERHAGFTFNSLQLTRDPSDNPLIRVNVTKAELKAMPEWKWQPASSEWRASKLIGTKVTNTAGETIGDINEMLVNKDGEVAAAVIGVGGFLGLGERHAAIAFKSLKLTRDLNDNPLVGLNVTKDQLKLSPEWKWQAVRVN